MPSEKEQNARRGRRLVSGIALLLLLLFGVWLSVRGRDGGMAPRHQAAVQTSHGEWQGKLVRLAARRDVGEKWSYSGLANTPEPMPQPLRELAIRNLGGHQILGLRFGQAQYVHTKTGGGVWVVRGRQLTCIFQAVKAASSCAPDFIVVKRGLQLVVGLEAMRSKADLPKHFLAIGIEPDDVREVRLRPVGAGFEVVPVIHNVFSLRAGSPIRVEGLIH